MKNKFVIWDVDGTLFDTYPAIVLAYLHALESMGARDDFASVMNLALITLSHCNETLASRHSLPPDELGRRFNDTYAQVGPEDQPPFPLVIAACKAVIDQGGNNFIATHRRLAGLQELLQYHQMIDLFSDFVTADDGLERKPSPAIFQRLIERHALPVDQTLTIGDRDIDLLAGKAAGIKTCYFGTPDAPAAELADFTITHYEQFPSLLVDDDHQPA